MWFFAFFPRLIICLHFHKDVKKTTSCLRKYTRKMGNSIEKSLDFLYDIYKL